MKLREAIDTIFSHNEVVAIWEPINEESDGLEWDGMAHEIPEKWLDREDWTIKGIMAENICQSDFIHVVFKNKSEETKEPKSLSMGLKPEEVLHDLKLVRDGITDDESYQRADAGVILSSLDDVISMCEFAFVNGYGGNEPKCNIFDYMKDKYDNREDKGNIFPVGISDAEFRAFAIDYLLGEDWYVVDPLAQCQINEIALETILVRFSRRYKKEKRKYGKDKK